MRKKILLFLLLLLMPVFVHAEPITRMNEETHYQLIIEDEAELLTEAERHQLEDQMMPLTEYGNIAFITIGENPSGSTEVYAENYYYDHFRNDSGTLMIIDMDSRYIYICSAGDNYRTITDEKAYIITDNIYRYARSGDYFECAMEAFREINKLLSGGKILEPMRYTSNIIISLVLGFFFAFFFVMATARTKQASNKELLDSGKKELEVVSSEVKKTGDHRVYNPHTDSGSSGGSSYSGGSSGGFSGGGGGGGGGFSGGGGGHGF